LEIVKLESGKKNIHKEAQVLNIDSKSTNNPQLLQMHLMTDVWLTVHRNSVWIRKTN